MEENKTYYDELFTKSDEEIKVDKEIDREINEFESTPEYIAYKERLDALWKRSHQLMVDRLSRVKTNKRERLRQEHIDGKVIDIEVLKAQIKARKEKEYNELPDSLKTLISAYNELTKEEKKKFDRETSCRICNELNKYENPQTQEKDLKELLEILVQECVDFINERGLKDIEEIHFGVDGLQTSAENGTWCPDSDASIWAAGYNKEDFSNGKKYNVRQFIGEYL